MPQGKGTYGSQVGRPPKKQKKYKAGGEVGMSYDPFSTKNTEGVPAEKYAEEVDKANKMEELNKTLEPDTAPTANAQDRSQTFQVGGKVLEYKEGGKVDPADLARKAGTGLSKGAKKGYERPTYTPWEGSKTPIQDLRDFNTIQDIKEKMISKGKRKPKGKRK